MPTLDVACFGEVLWDLFEVRSAAAPSGGSALYTRELGGAPANVATALARLGVKASIVGGIGKDRFGDELAALLAGEGVETRHLVRLPNRTGITFVHRDARGEPSFLFYRHESADSVLGRAHMKLEMGKARFGLVGTSTLMTPGLRSATLAFTSALAKARGALVVDLNVRAHLWPDKDEMRAQIAALVARAAVVKASHADLEAVAGRRGLPWLEENARNATWVLTRGEGGATAVGIHGEVKAPSRSSVCVDATGAGDAFLAGLLAVLVRAQAWPRTAAFGDAKLWSRAMEAGHMMGARAVSAVGAVTGLTKLDEVRTHIQSSGSATSTRRRPAPRRGK